MDSKQAIAFGTHLSDVLCPDIFTEADRLYGHLTDEEFEAVVDEAIGERTPADQTFNQIMNIQADVLSKQGLNGVAYRNNMTLGNKVGGE